MTPVMILGVFPALTVLISFQRALLVQRGNTSPITMATVIEVTGILSVLYLAIIHLQVIGVTAAAMAFLSGRLAANTYLHLKLRRLSRRCG
jgi:progressive ankylosis protein